MAYEKLNRRLAGGNWDIHPVLWCYLFDGGSMKEEALKLADELQEYMTSLGWQTHQAPDMIRRLVEELDKKPKPLERTDVYGLAIESGFMLSTQHGQAEHKLMPVTDGDTLMALVKAIEERHGIK